MSIDAISSPVQTSKLSLQEIARNPQIPQSEKIAEASRQFEAVLLRHILQETRKTIFHSDAASDSVTSGIYQDMITEQLAENISRSGTFGLARSLQSELGRQLANKTPSSSAPITPTTHEISAAPHLLTGNPRASHD